MPTFDNANSVKGTSVSSLETSAWTIAAGDNRLLLAGMAWADSSPTTYSAIRWQGSSGTLMTQIGTQDGTSHRVAMSKLANPAAVNSTLYGLINAVQSEMCLGGISYADAGTVSIANSSSGSGAGTTFSSTVNIGSAAGKLVVSTAYGGTEDGVCTSCDVVTGAGQISRWEQEDIAGFSAGDMSEETGAASVTMSADFTMNTSDNYSWCVIGVSVDHIAPWIPEQNSNRTIIQGFGLRW